MARDALRVRIKAVRDRMLFRPPPARPRAAIAPLADPAVWHRGSCGRGAAAAGAEPMIHVMLPMQDLREFENLCEAIGVDASSLRQRLAEGQVSAV